MSYYDIVESPLGPVFIGGSSEGVHRIDFIDDGHGEDACVDMLEQECGERPERDVNAASVAAAQLRQYFAGERTHFELPLAGRGTEFQRHVWKALGDVPYGETASYGEIARSIGRPEASRAVGAANGKNPIAIVVPCHRIVGSNGTLTGYGGGLDRKAWLLNLEAQALRPMAAR